MQKLIQLREIIFNLNAENVHKSAQAAMNLFPKRSYSYSFDLIVSKLIYSYIVSHVHEKEIYFFLSFLQVISREGSNDIIKVFTKFLLDQCSQESYFILNEMLYLKLIKPDVIKKTKNLFFSHYISESVIQESRYNPELSYFFDNYDELSKNYWLLHKKVIKKGVNPNEIAKIIRNDEIEKLQEISSKQKFNFNQTVNPSIYERCSFINKNNVSLIDYAAFFGSIQCFKYLLINGANVSNTGKYALVGGNIEIIHLCEQNHSSFRGAYETAIMFNKFDIFYYLYENNKEILKNLNEIGKICIKYNNYELLTFLEKEGMKTDESLINEAARNGDLFLVIYYHQNFKLPQNILGFASKSENIEIIKYILGTKESDVNAKFDGLTALIFAVENCHIETLKLLLKHKEIDVNVKDDNGHTAIMIAYEKRNSFMLKLLLEQKGIDVNTKGKDGRTILIQATKKGYVKIVKLFLEHEGIDVNVKDDNGKTALIYAAEGDDTKTVELLLQHKEIDVNAQDNNGKTALMYAAKYGYAETIELLLQQKNINVNAQDNNGETALMYAVMNDYNPNIFNVLVEHEGIDVNIKNNHGETALSLIYDPYCDLDSDYYYRYYVDTLLQIINKN